MWQPAITGMPRIIDVPKALSLCISVTIITAIMYILQDLQDAKRQGIGGVLPKKLHFSDG